MEVLQVLAITSAGKLLLPNMTPSILFYLFYFPSCLHGLQSEGGEKKKAQNNVPDETLKAFLFKVIMISIYAY